MSTEIATRREMDSWAEMIGPVGDLAQRIAGTPFVPKDFLGKPAAVAACILMGRAVGIDPMVALQHVSIVQGRPVLSAELMRSLILSNGHQLRFPEMSSTRVVVEGRRKGDEDWTRVQFTLDDAKAAGIVGKDNWRKHPQEMLAARATSRLARLIFADCLGGLSYTADEMSDPDATAETGAAPRARGRTVRRAAPRPMVDTPPLDDEPAVDTMTGEIVEAEIVEDDPPLDDEPQMASAPQLKAMGAAFTAVGWTDRDDRLRATSAIVNREVHSAKDLTREEAGALLDTLTVAQQSDDPNAYLLALFEAVGRGD